MLKRSIIESAKKIKEFANFGGFILILILNLNLIILLKKKINIRNSITRPKK
jgi:hypothetical protein